jgi:hypothetical protein
MVQANSQELITTKERGLESCLSPQERIQSIHSLVQLDPGLTQRELDVLTDKLHGAHARLKVNPTSYFDITNAELFSGANYDVEQLETVRARLKENYQAAKAQTTTQEGKKKLLKQHRRALGRSQYLLKQSLFLEQQQKIDIVDVMRRHDLEAPERFQCIARWTKQALARVRLNPRLVTEYREGFQAIEDNFTRYAQVHPPSSGRIKKSYESFKADMARVHEKLNRVQERYKPTNNIFIAYQEALAAIQHYKPKKAASTHHYEPPIDFDIPIEVEEAIEVGREPEVFKEPAQPSLVSLDTLVGVPPEPPRLGTPGNPYVLDIKKGTSENPYELKNPKPREPAPHGTPGNPVLLTKRKRHTHQLPYIPDTTRNRLRVIAEYTALSVVSNAAGAGAAILAFSQAH